MSRQFKEGNRERAIEQCQPLAEDGDATAQALMVTLNLGVSGHDPAYYEWRVRVGEHLDAVDLSKALGAWQPRAEAGDAYAQLAMGWLLVADDNKAGLSWFRKSADQGNSMAQWAVGSAYDRGLAVKRSLRQALKWYELAAGQGNGIAAFGIGEKYEFGYLYGIRGITRGVPRDYEEAARWYRMAAEQGHVQAQTSTGYLLQAGLGANRDDQQPGLR